MIDALILDYGGVLLHEDPADYHPIDRSLGFAEGRLWALAHGIEAYRPSRIGALSGEQFQQALHAQLRRLAGDAAADAAMAALLAYYRTNESIRPAMRELLASAKGTIKLAVLSNATRGSTARLERLGLLDHVDIIVCSGDIGIAKPDPESYLYVARRLAIAPERCAFVDDVQTNVDAAIALGMQAMRYHHSRHDELIDALHRWRVPG
ncbi:HAD family hydrolase [Lysobacter sp. CA196]|uniref:HAD family hydrolase n=1 Tax=Lysobacter sp. CA196 TaxID=3455606 RepID=UPI003F8D2182